MSGNFEGRAIKKNERDRMGGVRWSNRNRENKGWKEKMN